MHLLWNSLIKMHPALKTVLTCILVGLAFGLFFYFFYDHRIVRVWMSVLSSLNIGSLMMLLIYKRHYVTSFIDYPPLTAVIITLLLVIAGLLGTEITIAEQSLLPGIVKYRPLSGGNIYILNILIVLVVGLPIYVNEEWRSLLNSRILNQQYRVLQLEQQQTLFELELLRAKINPHFLYNVHNTIAALISKDPLKAEELVLLLSRFFRFTLSKSSATFHSVTDELDIISTYLQMQQIRYETRMQYTIKADPQTLNLQMPSFILQPLVENAVKHGIEASAANGCIEVVVALAKEHISITVADSGPAFPSKPGGGLGLQMVMNKLRLLYGDHYIMELNNAPEKYVRIILPHRIQNPAG